MSVYDLHFNKDDVTIRNIIIGLLATLHESIGWYNQIGTDIHQRRRINVPFYFSTTGTERYLQDNFLNNIDFDPDNLQAESFYNKIPRGIVDLTGITVEAQNIVNKYVRMNHQVQEQDGTLNTYNTETFWVPILLTLDCKVYTDSTIDQLKCTESIITTFFKSRAYQVDVAYTRIPCLITFPDDYTNEKTIEFSFTDKREFTTSFSLQVKSHIPVFKPQTTIFAGNTMEGFQTNVLIPPIQFGSDGGNNTGSTIAGDAGSLPSTSNPTINGPENTNLGSGGSGLYGNLAGNPSPTGNVGLTFGDNIPDLPTWPVNPNSEFPPGPTTT